MSSNKKITKKVPYGRILFEGKKCSFHATKGWRAKNISQDNLTNGYNKIVEFLLKGK